MNDTLYRMISIDLWPLMAGILVAVTCGLIGNFLLLRKMSLMGDAISHAVVPGIVAAFLVASSRTSWVIFIGAAIAGIFTTILVETVRRLGRLEAGAAMGVVFSILFALGILMMEQAAARHIDLDADCLLHGQIETLIWFPPKVFALWWQEGTWAMIPSEIYILILTLVAVLVFLWLFFKELTLSSFDSALCDALGFSSKGLHYLLMMVVALCVVASFFSVGSILVIAMLICPGACARHFTDRLRTQLFLSTFFALAIAITGYFLGAFLPQILGFSHSISISGSMSMMAGAFLFLSLVVAPQHGLIAKALARLRFELRVAEDDLYGFLYRLEEVKKKDMPAKIILDGIGGGRLARKALAVATLKGLVVRTGDFLLLSEEGRKRAKAMVRTHRLWENFLNRELGLPPDHLHIPAERLEHFTTPDVANGLVSDPNQPLEDPHGKPIPEKE